LRAAVLGARSAWTAGLWLVAVMHAHAQAPLPLELRWQAPSECPSSADLRAELERIARVRPGFGLTLLMAQAEVEHHGAQYTTTLYTEQAGQKGERRLEALDCKTLARTVTLVLALAFGAGVELAQGEVAPKQTAASAPVSAESASAPRPTQSAGPPPPQSDTPQVAAAKTPSTDHTRADRKTVADDDHDRGVRNGALSLAVLAGGGAQFGLMPAALSASAGAELTAGAFSIELRASAWPGASEGVATKLRARFDGLAGALQGCRQVPLADLTLALCGRAWAAALRGRSSGASSDGSATAPWYALASAISLTWPAGRFLRLRIEAALAASLDRPRFIIQGFGQVHRIPLLVPDLGAFLIVAP
jgi:hypothetical protein